MEQVRARAALAPASGLDEGLSTTIARSEIQDALAADEAPIELALDLTRFSDGEPTETRKIAVAWERSDLEQLLTAAQGDEIVLTFDRETLRQAMEDDVEGHGLRETALLLTVAAAAAAGTAAGAAAEPGPQLGQAAPIVQSTSPDDRAVSRADAAAPSGLEIPYLSQGQGVTPADLGIADSGVAPDDRAVPRADAAAPSGLEIPYLSQGQGVTPADLGIADASVSPDDRAVARTEAVARGEAASTPAVSPDDRAVSRADPAGQTGLEIPYLSQGQGVTPADLGIAGASVSPDDRAVPRTDPAAPSGLEIPYLSQGQGVTPADLGIATDATGGT
ncbi:MAG TPA: hypothetical protein VFO03_08740, partial [Gaiellaceae bacterium]|nr:hypothetical protein [Gaiellaceae bacterium]